MTNKKSTKKDLHHYTGYFKQKWNGSKPIYKLFKNETGGYIFDKGTGKILDCEEPIYTILDKFSVMDVEQGIEETLTEFSEEEFLDAAGKIASAIETENVLKAYKDNFIFYGKHHEDIDGQMANAMGHIVLEVTESCNLRCAYCIYDGKVDTTRSHGTKHMSEKTARAGIDYLLEHSSHLDAVSITFYGGEPLLRFPFVKFCVEYARNAAKDKTVHFSLTTNAVLLTPEIAQYLAKENFSLTVSIDGPGDIHDNSRLDTEGNGTFSRTIAGLKLLVDAYGDKAKEVITLSMVYAPPFSEKKLNRIAGLWEQYPWLGGILPTITYPQPDSIPPEKMNNALLNEDKNIVQWMQENYLKAYKEGKTPNILVKEIATRALLLMFRRVIYDRPIKELNLNGTCLPGVRKIFVSARGEYALCERIHEQAPKLGHVNTGIDHQKVKETFIDEYAEKSASDCQECWAGRICRICYIDTYTDGAFDLERKRAECQNVRSSAERQLNFYTRLLAIDPEGLNFLNDIQLN